MIIINGRVFSGDNAVIVNGRIMGGDGNIKVKKFDERKSADAKEVEKISINSEMINVNISESNSSQVEVHFYGQANIDGNIDFDVCLVNRELRITLKFGGSCYSSNLKIDVTVPKKTFKSITARGTSADFTLEEGVSTQYLNVRTQSGDLESEATFTDASISTMSGDVDLYIDAKESISLDVSTMSGDVSVEFHNIGVMNLSTNTKSGDVRNRYKGGTGYPASVDISTMSGDIKIK